MKQLNPLGGCFITVTGMLCFLFLLTFWFRSQPRMHASGLTFTSTWHVAYKYTRMVTRIQGKTRKEKPKCREEEDKKRRGRRSRYIYIYIYLLDSLSYICELIWDKLSNGKLLCCEDYKLWGALSVLIFFFWYVLALRLSNSCLF